MRSLPAAFFLACSWFWCIGGFLPILLDQEFGKIAFPFFMFFNVVGAALFGFVWDEAARARFLSRFLMPAQFFSVLVVGYHLVFMGWISTLLQSPVPLVGFICVTAFFHGLRRQLAGAAVGVFVLTVVLFAMALNAPLPAAGPDIAEVQPFSHQVLPLALGFLLAPYFDLTFHRAFAESTNPRLGFLVGFGVLFAALLAGVWLATPVLAQLLTARSFSGEGLQAVVAILVLQTGFTTAAHLREVSRTRWFRARRAVPVVAVVTVLVGLHLAVWLSMPAMLFPAGELVYRGFVFLIGVLFPVFLLFGGVNRYAIMVMAFLTPCYTLGFLIGGAYAPFLSVAVAGLVVLFWIRPQAALHHPQ